MIHIATVHWKTDKWIDVQLRYLKKHIHSEYRIYSFLNDVPGSHVHNFFYSSSEPIEEHAIKLNLLAERICWSGRDEDIILFLDGDAFPISDDITGFLRSMLPKHKLVAIQQTESLGDMQPHPSFCATTVGFWKKIQGDWKMGYLWNDSSGLPITDVGGNLLNKLQKNKVNWLPLHRTNKKNLHPLWFGVYENLIYHHGAGFREPSTRADRISQGLLVNLMINLAWLFKTISAFLETRIEKSNTKIVQKNKEIQDSFYEELINDPLFYKKLV